MKKFIIMISAAVFGALTLNAARITVDVNGTFAENGKGWHVINSKGGVLKVIPEGGLELLRNPNTPYADANYRKSFVINPKTRVTVKFRAKGNGAFSIGLRLKNSGAFMRSFPLTEKYSDFSYQINFEQTKAQLPDTAVVKFLITGKTEKVTVESCHVEIDSDTE